MNKMDAKDWALFIARFIFAFITMSFITIGYLQIHIPLLIIIFGAIFTIVIFPNAWIYLDKLSNDYQNYKDQCFELYTSLLEIRYAFGNNIDYRLMVGRFIAKSKLFSKDKLYLLFVSGFIDVIQAFKNPAHNFILRAKRAIKNKNGKLVGHLHSEIYLQKELQYYYNRLHKHLSNRINMEEDRWE